MGHALVQLLEILLRGMKGASNELAEGIPKMVGPLFNALRRTVNVAALPEVFFSFLIAIGIAAVIVGLVMMIHVALVLARRPRASVFVSFYHQQEQIASALEEAMTRSGIQVLRLPFEKQPDHDSLLDRIDQLISQCDVFVCIPGDKPSFVENEVGIAFAHKKPLLFVMTEETTPRLPNTAKKGYPIFSLGRIEQDGIRTFVNFCSYLATDWRATIRLYGAAFAHLGACATMVGSIFVVLIVAMTVVGGAPDSTESVVSANSLAASFQWLFANTAIIWFFGTSLTLFLIPYTVFLVIRFAVRSRVIRAISGKKFDATYLPETLDISLRRKELSRILCHGGALAEHEVQYVSPPVA